MSLPPAAKLVVAVAAISGIAIARIAIVQAADSGIGSPAVVAVLGIMVALTWVRPLLIYRGAESEAVHLDEGFFVIMALLLPPAGTILAFGLAMVIAQVFRRRPVVKSIFNFGQVLASVGAGLAVVTWLAPVSDQLTWVSLVAACLGALVFFAVNTCSLGAILRAAGASSFRKAITDGVEIRLVLVGACVGVGVVSALAVGSHPWTLVLSCVPFLILRQALAGHFRSRHDRERMRGLFEATVDANRLMGSRADIEASLCHWATKLLRTPHAELVDALHPVEGLSASLGDEAGSGWLLVSGRNKAEPFDSADQALLEALTAVGAGALSNQSLYAAVQHHEERLATITSTLGEGVCAVDGRRRLTFANPAAQLLLDLDAGTIAAINGGEAAPVRLDFLDGPLEVVLTSRTTVRVEDATFLRRDGGRVPIAFTCSPIVADGVATGAVVVFRDISERKAFEERLAHHAFHDALTGLPNRRVFLDRLENTLNRATRRSETHAVLFADIDRFKVVNDGIGHLGGDHLLIAIAQRLSDSLRPGDTLARFGGDEFTVLLQDADATAAASAASRILATLDRPILLPSGHQVVATMSIGVALTTATGTADDVLHDADVAMYQAKAKGPGRFEIFDAEAMGSRSIDRVELETALRKAIESDEIEVHYQPVFAMPEHQIVGAEALVRWRHPQRGLISPIDFIGLAEDTGLILRLGRRVLEVACAETKRWQDQTGQPISVSVNLSARQFGQPDLADQVAKALANSGLAPVSLCLEITETVAMQDLDKSIATMHQLKQLGVRLAIDDFGTGYSSLNYLKRFPVDVVKLDRSFVAGVETSSVDTAIISAVVGLAAAIGMTTIAEGVETDTQLDALTSLGCHLIQGFALSKPLTKLGFEALLACPPDRRSEEGEAYRLVGAA